MTTIQVVSIEHPTGRPYRYVRVFGYRVSDARMRVVEVAVPVAEASDLIADGAALRAFPEIEVPDNSYVMLLNANGVKVINIAPDKEGS